MLWWFKTTELDAVKHSRRARCWKWNRFRDLISATIPGGSMPDGNRRKGQNWNSTKQSCCLEMFWEIMAFVSFSANMPKKCQICQIVAGKPGLKMLQFQDSFVICLSDWIDDNSKTENHLKSWKLEIANDAASATLLPLISQHSIPDPDSSVQCP